jgi:gluconolactonase
MTETTHQNIPGGTPIEIDMLAPGGERIVGRPMLEVIATDITFGEGPVWDARTGQLYFTDICGDTIWKWKPGTGQEIVLRPSALANGMALDLEGRLVVAGWSGRTVFRFERDGSFRTLASHYEGRKLNSPNDVVVRHDGSIFFTDSPGGLVNVGMVGDDLQKYLDIQGVYRISPDGQELSLATADFTYPNGLCFSPDESLLYINDSRDRLIRVYDVQPDGAIGRGRLFHQYTSTERGVPDGMKVDSEGNVYCTGPGGIYVHDTGGNVLARLRMPGHSTNFGWGDDDWRTLYVTMLGSVVRLRLNIPGVPSR